MAAPRIYSATYSNIAVYDYNVSPEVHIMRRKHDDWINATHILIAAGFDKPARTRVLEREVQKGLHEKVQGGYGKYQGTWIPLSDGRDLAERSNVLPLISPILDFVKGDTSPPPAPKHPTAQAKPRAQRAPGNPNKRIAASKRNGEPRPSSSRHSQIQHPPPTAVPQQPSQQHLETPPVPHFMDDMPEDASIADSMVDDDLHGGSYPSAKKRKRDSDQEAALQDQEHQIWADALLDYFMLADSEDSFPSPPIPPPGIDLNRPIEDKGHSALHWAAAMGDLEVVKNLIDRGARIDNTSNNFETPLMRAVMFTNNFDKGTMDKMVRLLQSSVHKTDWFGSTVFHHIAATTSSKNKYLPARYYLDTIINTLAETWLPDEITRLLNVQDHNLDTAIHIAARHGARKCVRSLLGRNVALDIPNNRNETADDMIRLLNDRRRTQMGVRREASSSPFGPDRIAVDGSMNTTNFASMHGGLAAPSALASNSTNTIHQQPVHTAPQYRSQTANSLVDRVATSLMARCRTLAAAYEAEHEEKVAEATEHDQVVRKRQAEIDALSRQLMDAQAQLDALASELGTNGGVAASNHNGGADTATTGGATATSTLEAEREREEAEVNALEQEALSLLEYEHREALRQHVAKNLLDGTASSMRPPPLLRTRGNAAAATTATTTTAIPSTDNNATISSGGNSGEDPNEMAASLARAQQERQRLTTEIVRSLSVAGLGEKTGEYKRLICGALNVREDEVQSHLDDIIGQLEEDRQERMVVEVDA